MAGTLSGTVTFLFRDVEASMRLLHELAPDASKRSTLPA
jgi:hypothetical protein